MTRGSKKEKRDTEQLASNEKKVSLEFENKKQYEQRTEIYQPISEGADGSLHEVVRQMAKTASNDRRREASTSDARQIVSRKRSKCEQLAALVVYAKKNGFWIEDTSTLGEQFSKGGENEVLHNSDTNTVFKLNNFEYAGDDIVNFFDRIDAHNQLFPNSFYQFIGIAQNSKGEISAVLEQPFVVESHRLATPYEIAEYMQNLGFKKVDEDTFTNGEYEVFDAFANNVLLGADERS